MAWATGNPDPIRIEAAPWIALMTAALARVATLTVIVTGLPWPRGMQRIIGTDVPII